MADGRIIHRKASQGDRVRTLSHLEYRVWTQYLLSADDYGVMRASVNVIQGDNPTLELEPARRIQQAMNAIVTVGLVKTFEHQGALYWWQIDWQDWQQIRYPRDAVHPAPNENALKMATEATRKLFSLRSVPARQRLRRISETVPVTVSETVTETSPLPTRAGGRETLTLTPTQAPTLPHSDEEMASGLARVTVVSPQRPGRQTPLVSSHMGCFFAPNACARGLCIPSWLGTEWLQQFSDPQDGQTEIAAFVASTIARLPDGPVGDAPKDFWRAAWRSQYGSVVRAGSRTGDSVAAAQAYLAGELAKERGPA